MTWALTKWGLVCQSIADEFVDAYPQFTIGIGPDPESLADMGHRVTFVVLDGNIVEPRYAGNDTTHGTFDEELPIRISIHVPTNIDSATNYDTSPVLAESAKEKLFEAIDTVVHMPYGVPKSIARRGGCTDEAGTTIIINMMLRIENKRTHATMAIATSSNIGLSAKDPDGSSDSIELPIDAP